MSEEKPVKKTSLASLFLAFAKIGVMTFGGGYAMLPMLEREVVDNHGWTTSEQMMDPATCSRHLLTKQRKLKR